MICSHPTSGPCGCKCADCIATAVSSAVAEERATGRATQDAIHADLSDLLDALGMGTHARPDSPHTVMQQAIAKVRALVEERATTGRRIAAVEALIEEAGHGRMRRDYMNNAAFHYAIQYLRAALASPGEET